MGDQRTLRVVVVGNASQAQGALQQLGDSADDTGGRFEGLGGRLGGLGEKLKGLGPALAAGLAMGGIATFTAALDEIGNRAKLAASMGLTGADGAKAGKLAGDLYVQGFGESTAETGQIVKRVHDDLDMSVNSVDFKPIASKVGTVAKVMDQDIGGVTRAVANLMRNGLAKNANEALDIVSAGFTHGVDKSEDFLDTLNEYGTQFRKLGLDGATATGILSQGLKGGARDADLVADAIKEFSIRAVDGSTATAQGFKTIGLDASDMAKRIGKGGKSASDALQLTMDKLRKIKDPVKQSQAAVALFGTQSEDLGKALYSIDPKSAVSALGKVEGAAQKMSDTLSKNAAAKVETFKRKLQMGFTNAAASVITVASGLGKKVAPAFGQMGTAVAPMVTKVKNSVSQMTPAFARVGGVVLKTVVPYFRQLAATAVPVFATIARTVTGTVLPALMGLVTTLLPYFQQFVGFLRSQVLPVVAGMFRQAQPVIQQFGNAVKTVLQGIGVAVQVLAPILQLLWKFLGPVVVGTLKGLWSGILGVISGALSMIQGVVNVFIGIFTGNWSKVWTGVKQIFKGAWSFIVGAFKIYIYGSVVGILRGGVARLTALWRGGWTAIRGTFTGAVNFIRGGVSGWISGVRSTISGGVSFIRRIWSNGWSGIKTTISTNARGILQIAREIPGKIKGYFTGLPGKLKEIGRNIVDGLVNGIKGAWHKVTGVISSLADKIPGPIRSALGIHSPSRVMAEIGKWITEGLVKGMLGGSKKVGETSKKLSGLVLKAFAAHAISRNTRRSLIEYIFKQNRKLTSLAKERESVAKKLSAANAKLADLKKAKADMASSIRSKASDYAQLIGVYDSSEYGDNSASAIIARLKGKLANIVDFRKNLATLAKRGLGKGMIAELAQAGPEEGGAMAKVLLNADLGQIKQINSAAGQISKESTALGNQVAGNYYDAGIRATEGLIDGLKDKQSALTKAITNIAKSMVRTLKRALRIKSPSRVFMGLGGFTAAGFAAGLVNGQGDVQKAVDGLAGTRPTGRLANRSIARETALRGASGGQVAPVVHVTVQGNVTAEKALARSIATTIRDEIVRSGKRNGGRTGF